MTATAIATAALTLASVSLQARPRAAPPRPENLLRFRGGAVDEAPPAEETWDYILVGGGAAGCVLAERLSQADRRNAPLCVGMSSWDSVNASV